MTTAESKKVLDELNFKMNSIDTDKPFINSEGIRFNKLEDDLELQESLIKLSKLHSEDHEAFLKHFEEELTPRIRGSIINNDKQLESVILSGVPGYS